MYRLSLYMQGGDSGRCKYDNPFFGSISKKLKQGRLSCTGTSCDEEMLVATFQERYDIPETMIQRYNVLYVNGSIPL